MFSIIFFRLWYLQVLSGDRYLHRANDNRIRDVHEQGPRGEILDANGNVLVGNRLQMGARGCCPDGPSQGPEAARA